MIFENIEFIETKYKNYYVSRCGKLLVCFKNKKKIKTNLYIDRSGYYRPTISIKPSVGRRVYLHTLVAETFIGKRPDGMVIDHIDKNKLNNSIENLRYISNKENISRSHIGVKPKLKMKSILILDHVQYEFQSINKMLKFLGLTRNQYERFLHDSHRVKHYKLDEIKVNSSVFLKLSTMCND